MARLITAVRFRIEAALLSMTISVFRQIPVDFASSIMAFLWKSLAPLTRRHKRALGHLAMAFPDLSDAERQAIARGMWANLGAVAAETFQIDRLMEDDARFEAVADQATSDILKDKRACVMVSLHSANWELCVLPAVRHGLAVTSVYQALRNKVADDILRGLRVNLYKGGLLSKGHETARTLVRTLRKGGAVGLMGDLREARGVEVTFFGQPAFATPVPAALARTYKVPIILGRTVRLKGVHFKIEGKALFVPETDDKQADIALGTQQIHDVFETWIREHPEQWMWIHRKWARPNKSAGKRRLVREAPTKSISDR